MKRFLLDTNIYGEIILDSDFVKIKTEIAENALKAYDLVNALKKKRTPKFIGYLEFKRWLI